MTVSLPAKDISRKLLVTDLDGTAVDSEGVMHPATIHALNALRARGHVVCYATGRRAYDMQSVPYLYSCADYVILNTGSVIMDVRTQERLFDRYVDPAAARTLIDTCLREGWQLYVILSDGFGINIMTDGVMDYARLTKVQPQMYQSADAFDLGAVQGFMASRDREQIVSFIRDSGLPLTCICSEPECFDIIAGGLSKWTSIERLAGILHIPTENTVAMGNWLNDLDMVTHAGCGVAVGDAVDELKAAADYVTPRGHNEDAVLDVCRHCFGITNTWEESKHDQV